MARRWLGADDRPGRRVPPPARASSPGRRGWSEFISVLRLRDLGLLAPAPLHTPPYVLAVVRDTPAASIEAAHSWASRSSLGSLPGGDAPWIGESALLGSAFRVT